MLSETHKGIKPSKETLEKRSVALKEAHKTSLNYKKVPEKISKTKKEKGIGNGHQNKLRLVNVQTNNSIWVFPENVFEYKNGYKIKAIKLEGYEELFSCPLVASNYSGLNKRTINEQCLGYKNPKRKKASYVYIDINDYNKYKFIV